MIAFPSLLPGSWGTEEALPLLAFTLRELWERREESSSLEEVYESLGGVQGSVGRVAEELTGSLPEEEAQALRTAFVERSGSGARPWSPASPLAHLEP